MIFRQSYRAFGAFGAFSPTIGLRLNRRLKPEGIIRHALPWRRRCRQRVRGQGRTNVGPQLLFGLLDGGLLTLQNSSGKREVLGHCRFFGNQLRRVENRVGRRIPTET
jgi:hypothetical protein